MCYKLAFTSQSLLSDTAENLSMIKLQFLTSTEENVLYGRVLARYRVPTYEATIFEKQELSLCVPPSKPLIFLCARPNEK